ncbi:hypothetical protein JKP88DRAFT_311585 [Tribonema minus]|uniref:RING-type domain-containing protein n=1 Tax=Tribonema minus TaxID=303371 RepID=A0A836CHN6_9STRA|nr:hypothetical protein JKP88DRAFT_311585 [Tribonema minus]
MDIAAAAATGELLVVRNSLTSKGLRKCGLALHNIGTVLIAGGQAHESEMGRECDEATVALLVMVLSTVGPDVRVISQLNVSQFVEQHEMLSRRVRLATGKTRAASGDAHGSAVVAVASGLGRAASDASCKSGALAPSLPQLNHFSLKSGYMCGDVCLASLSEGLLLQAFLQQGSDALVEGLLGPVRGARRVRVPAAFWEWCEAGGAAPTYGDLFFWLLDRFDCITLGLQRRCAEGAPLDRSQHGGGGDAGYDTLSIANPRASLALEPGDRAFVLLPRGVAEHLAEAAQQAAERFIASTESLQQQGRLHGSKGIKVLLVSAGRAANAQQLRPAQHQRSGIAAHLEYESFRRERTPGRGRSPSPASANGGDASRSRPPTPEARSVNGGGSPPQRIGGGGGGADAPGRAGMRQAAPAWPSALPLGPVPGRSPSPAHAAHTSLFTAVLGPGNNNMSTDTIPAIGGGGGADAGTPLPQGGFFGDAPRMLRSARSSSDAAADRRGSGGSGSAAAAAAAAADAALAAWAVRALVARSPQSVHCAFAPAHDCVLLGCGHVTCSACLNAAASAGDIAQCWRCLEPVRLMLVLPPPAPPSEPS